jgi:Fe-S cluster assembly protein SufD
MSAAEIDREMPPRLMAEPSVPQWVTDNFNLLERSLNGHKSDAIHRIRRDALEIFKKKGFPTPKNEDWKYTNLRELSEKRFILPAEAIVSLEALKEHLVGGESSPRLVFVDGIFSESLSNVTREGSPIAGAEFSILNSADLGSTEIDNALIALNASFLKD